MPKIAKPLTAIEVRRLTTPGLHFVGTVPGLALAVKPSGARAWKLRAVVAGKRRDMGLGPFPAVTLAGAIEAARAARAGIDGGADPIGQRRELVRELVRQQARALTFEQAARDYITAHRSDWRNAKHAAQWLASLAAHAFPTLGPLSVATITTDDVYRTLAPIWLVVPETASRVRGRVEKILDAATVRGAREGLNPARWRGHLDHLLPQRAPPQHHRALPIDDLPALLVRLRQCRGTAARALEFAILTAARSGEVRGAMWGELDLAAGIWTVPGERMKAGRPHRVPLAPAALALLAAMAQYGTAEAIEPNAGNHTTDTTARPPGALVFPAPRGGVLSDMALTAVLRRLQVQAVPHGFRSTFRDWCSERTAHARELAEWALAHSVGGKTERAYARSDLLERRRPLMVEWAAFVGSASEA